ncbi:MAG: hypothetical protein Q9178_002726 [Gyalolechia marmorata]
MGSTIPQKDAWTRARDRYVEDLSTEEQALYESASPESILYDASAAEKIDKFRIYTKNVEKEASLSHMIEASDSRAVVRANLGQLEKAREEDARCGKTILASSIVNTLRTNALLQRTSIVYYYYDYADQRTLQAKKILGTILKQFFINGHIPEEVEKRFPQDYGEDAQTLEANDLIDLICMTIKQTALTFVIIDGLDECEKNSREVLLSLLTRLNGSESSTIKTFISCRQEDQILRSLQKVPMIQMTTSALEGDIRIYVAASVSSRITSGELRIRDRNLVNEITNELVDKAHGMFLWVFFQLDDLCEAPSDALIRKVLRNLPYGLIETYERILKKIWRNTIKRDLVRKIFMWMLCARRPLVIEELREAAGFEPDQKFWDSEMLPDADLMTEACKGLVIWDREDGLVRFAHHTIQQFLLSDPIGTQEISLTCTHSKAELHVGDMCLTYLLFSNFETKTQIWRAPNRVEKPSDVPGGGPAYWIPDLLGVRTSKIQQPFRLLGLGSKSSSGQGIDYARYLRSVSEMKDSALSADVAEKYKLLPYIVENWVFHTMNFVSSSSSAQKLQNLAMYKYLPFRFRPWGWNQHYGPYGCRSCIPGGACSSKAERLPFVPLLHYAAGIGHLLLMEPVIKEHCSHETKNIKNTFQWDEKAGHWLLGEHLLDERGHVKECIDSTICIAIRTGQELVFNRLFSQHRDEKPHVFGTLLNAAASYGHETIFRLILERLRKYHDDYFKVFAHITLAFAAAKGHQAIVEILWHEGVALDEKVDELGETPISASAANGQDDIIRLLIFHGAELLRRNVTPLHRAAQNGHATVARTIFQPPKSGYYAQNSWDPLHLVGALNGEGETPLHQAARNGHTNVVQVMLENAPVAGTRWLKARTSTSLNSQLAIHLAAANGHLAILELLLDQVEDTYDRLVDGLAQTPLILAAQGNHLSLAELLLSRRPFYYQQDHSGRTALDHAVIGGYREMTQLLIKHKPERISTTLLILAAQGGQEEILEFLIEAHRIRSGRESSEEFILRAFEGARADKLHGAANLLESYWRARVKVREDKEGRPNPQGEYE